MCKQIFSVIQVKRNVCKMFESQNDILNLILMSHGFRFCTHSAYTNDLKSVSDPFLLQRLD